MFRLLLTPALLALALAASGCATVMSGMQQPVEIVSDPPGAIATLDTGRKVQTPGKLRVEKQHAHEVTVSLEGYRPVTVPIARKVQWYVMGNIFFLIVPGMLVDFLGGGAFGLPQQLKVRLTPTPETLARLEAERAAAEAPPPDLVAPPDLGGGEAGARVEEGP
ncbi:MAG: PEGA domain-containing protein [Deltaproteobacteria bacterium]|nr:PEGA domain-containing protein [Deltaproteobacteria bacterium]